MRPIRFWISGTVSRSCLMRLVLWVFRIETYLRKWSINQERLGQILTGKKHNKHMDILIPTFIPYRGKHVRRPGSRACIFWNSCMVWNSTTSKPQHNTPGAHSHVGDGRKHISTVNGWTFDAVCFVVDNRIAEDCREISAEKGSEDSSDTDTAFTAKWMIMAVVVWRDKWYTTQQKKMHVAEEPSNEMTRNLCQSSSTIEGRILSRNRATPCLRSWIILLMSETMVSESKGRHKSNSARRDASSHLPSKNFLVLRILTTEISV